MPPNYLFICLSISPLGTVPVYLSISLFYRLFIHLLVNLSNSPSVFVSVLVAALSLAFITLFLSFKGHDLSADCWSLGILIFEFLTGRLAFSLYSGTSPSGKLGRWSRDPEVLSSNVRPRLINS